MHSLISEAHFYMQGASRQKALRLNERLFVGCFPFHQIKLLSRHLVFLTHNDKWHAIFVCNQVTSPPFCLRPRERPLLLPTRPPCVYLRRCCADDFREPHPSSIASPILALPTILGFKLRSSLPGPRPRPFSTTRFRVVLSHERDFSSAP